ncbi:scavenger receptor class A member 5-like isoform X2 [Saccostrea cucullata]|uniref:scavenger receptor class A member 5-like isoform X2 n=1 Tax=Saccostrea cuccullata TaxID=36930 RepID=UPI002ED10955
MCTFDLITPGNCRTNGFIRLVNGESSNEGRVEVFIKGEWGTVCDYGWDSSDARALCRSLGYTGNSYARSNGYFGQGSGPIWMSNVNCAYRESSFFDCPYGEYGYQNCRHSDDAGVTCK